MYLQSTGFVLDPAGKVLVSAYSSGAIGRLVPDDVGGLVRYVRRHAAASALPKDRLFFGQEAVPVRSRYQRGADAPAQDHQVITGLSRCGRRAACPPGVA